MVERKKHGRLKVRKRSRKICGVGVNDFKENVWVDGKYIKEYSLWQGILVRCYSEKSLTKRPTYIDIEVEEYLMYFTNFYNFIRSLKGFDEKDEYDRSFHLDKDLLVSGNKLYSTETICFIPIEVNSFLTKAKAIRGNYPIGVEWVERNKAFRAKLSMNNKVKELGLFKTPEEAFYAYKEAKENHAKELAEKWKDKINPRAYEALINYTVDIED